MSTFPLRIGTPDGLLYEGEVSRLVCRTISGDLAILPRHCNYCTALGMGEAHIVLEDGSRKTAACIGGMLSVMNGTCRVLATTWEWKEDIDAQRAEAAQKTGRSQTGRRRSQRQRISNRQGETAKSTGSSRCERIETDNKIKYIKNAGSEEKSNPAFFIFFFFSLVSGFRSSIRDSISCFFT